MTQSSADHPHREGALAQRLLPDGRELVVYPQLFTSRLIVGMPDAQWYDDCWCYHRPEDAIAAMNEWDGKGEPTGWHRHPPSGRRRPEGDAAAEYVMR